MGQVEDPAYPRAGDKIYGEHYDREYYHADQIKRDVGHIYIRERKRRDKQIKIYLGERAQIKFKIFVEDIAQRYQNKYGYDAVEYDVLEYVH